MREQKLAQNALTCDARNCTQASSSRLPSRTELVCQLAFSRFHDTTPANKQQLVASSIVPQERDYFCFVDASIFK
jgi:hypothetical protein